MSPKTKKKPSKKEEKTKKATKEKVKKKTKKSPKEKVSPRASQLPPKKTKEKPTKYFEGVGRRKTSVARVRIFTQGEKTFLVNDKTLEQYFPTFELQQTVLAPLQKMSCIDRFRVLVKVGGGGFHSQAEAVRHGISKSLIIFNPEFRKKLKKSGFLTRDPRMRERKKFGLKRARRAPQWKKR